MTNDDAKVEFRASSNTTGPIEIIAVATIGRERREFSRVVQTADELESARLALAEEAGQWMNEVRDAR